MNDGLAESELFKKSDVWIRYSILATAPIKSGNLYPVLWGNN
jgi:hypothetical protein